jgi:hypothetical protein
LERRVAALEQRMDDVYTLAAGASEEAGEVKAILHNHTRIINGFAAQINGRLDVHSIELAEIRQRLDGHDRMFGTLRAGQEQILVLLNQLVEQDGGEGPA